MDILFKNAERFSGYLRVLIHCLMSTFREHCSSSGRKATQVILILQ